jgi:hypothetical protein
MTVADEDDIKDLPPEEVYQFICNDFETAWNGIANSPVGQGWGGGNFLFAAQAMILLEWVCRLCAGDATGNALADFSRCLHDIRPAYFIGLPTRIGGNASDVLLPTPPPTQLRVDETPLLWLLFDVVRNGLIHQYQQILSELPDGKVYVSVTGPTTAHDNGPALTIDVSRRGGPGRHLKYIEHSSSVGIVLRPDWCYFDFTNAVKRAKLLERLLIPKGLERPDDRHPYPGLTAAAVRTAFKSVGITMTINPGRSWTNASPSSSTSFPPPGGLLPRARADDSNPR